MELSNGMFEERSPMKAIVQTLSLILWNNKKLKIMPIRKILGIISPTCVEGAQNEMFGGE